MLRHLPLNGHPFMGPNLYVTPPGSFTHFHQDGHGTVDSGHQCLRGRNEVCICLRVCARVCRGVPRLHRCPMYLCPRSTPLSYTFAPTLMLGNHVAPIGRG